MKKLAIVLAAALAVPVAAAAQAGPPATPQAGAGPQGSSPQQQAPGARLAKGMGPGQRDPKRARLALTLGLAEALELDDAQALKLRDTVDKFTQRRQQLAEQQRDAMQVLRAAAAAEKPDGAAVDQAIARLQESRSQLQAADRDFFGAVTRDLPAQKKARAALFLGRFHGRMMGRHAPGGPGGFGPGSMGAPGRPGQPGQHGMHGPGGMGGMGGPSGMNGAPPPGAFPGDELGLADDLDDEL